MRKCPLVLLILSTSICPPSFAQQGPDATASFARDVCGAPPSKIDSLVKGLGQVDSTRLRAVISTYHPASRDAHGTVSALSNIGSLPSAADLGTEATWTGVKPQTSELRAHAFGTLACRVPVARFDRGPAHLSFVATEHVARDPSVRDEVFKIIGKEFENSHPGAVVVEGYPEKFPCSEAVRIFLTPIDRIASEPEYLAKLALDHGAQVFGGEPDGIGLASPDNERFELLRQLTTIHGVASQEAYRRAQAQLPFGRRIPFSDFTAWYQRVNGRKFNVDNAWTDITPSYNMPTGQTIRGTNKMADQVDMNRDSHVVQVVRRGLLGRGRVLAVYGRDHFPRQLPVFEAVFGRCSTPVARCGEGGGVPESGSECVGR
ncbi:MAG: hypothetical protein HY075_06530 [Deltaproteobacteria bacterium]|nr:hypothetical protein [Deltaproteobacteria bacterium]